MTLELSLDRGDNIIYLIPINPQSVADVIEIRYLGINKFELRESDVNKDHYPKIRVVLANLPTETVVLRSKIVDSKYGGIVKLVMDLKSGSLSVVNDEKKVRLVKNGN